MAMSTRKRRIYLASITALAVAGIIATAILGFVVDRSQCKAAAESIDRSRTMWLYLIDQNPGPEADAFRIELDRRIPAAHCVGGRLVLDEADQEGP